MKKRVFITGGDGFIGSSLIHALASKGLETASFDANLNFIDNEPYYRRCLSVRQKHFRTPSKRYRGDIRNIASLRRAVNDFHPNVIVHLAGLPMARVLQKYQDVLIPINLYGTINVLDVFEKSSADRLVYTSSSMAYGHFKQTPQSENFILDPVNAYGACKAAGEYFVKLCNKEWSIVRPTSVYGFADCGNRVTQLLLDAAFLRRKVWVVRGETLDFSYVDDVAEGFVLAALHPAANHEIFNISHGESRAAVEFADLVKQFIPDFTYEVREPSVQQVYRGPQDISKAKKMLGYSPRYAIEKGIDTIRELVNRYHFYKGL